MRLEGRVLIRSVVPRNGLRRYWRRGDTRKLPSQYRRKIAAFMHALEDADSPRSLRGMSGLHRLGGNLAGFWAMKVSKNWRIWFRFKGGDVWDVELDDYH